MGYKAAATQGAPSRLRRTGAPRIAPGRFLASSCYRFRGGKLPVVSVYAALAPGSDARRTLQSKADSMLHQIRDLGEQRSLDLTARQSLQEDIARVQAARSMTAKR